MGITLGPMSSLPLLSLPLSPPPLSASLSLSLSSLSSLFVMFAIIGRSTFWQPFSFVRYNKIMGANEQTTSTTVESEVQSLDRMDCVEFFPPRANDRDLLTAEVFFGSLVSIASDRQPVSLEIAYHADEGVRYILRGSPEQMQYAAQLLVHYYPGSRVKHISHAEDPARHFANGFLCDTYEFRLTRPAYEPLRTHATREGRTTYSDLKMLGDPLSGVLSAMRAARSSAVLAQMIIGGMPNDWSKLVRGESSQIQQFIQRSPIYVLRALGARHQMALWALLVLAFVVALFTQWTWIFLLAAGLVLFASAVMLASHLLPAPPDPWLVHQKVTYHAFRTRIRVYIADQSPAERARMWQAIRSAYDAYALPGGNAFTYLKTSYRSPRLIMLPQRLLHIPYTGYFWPQRFFAPILSVGEISTLWHAPYGESPESEVHYAQEHVIIPPSEFWVRQPFDHNGQPPQHAPHNGNHHPRSEQPPPFPLGTVTVAGRVRTVGLLPSAFRGHMAIIAKTQSGKSTLMAGLAEHIMKHYPDAALIVIDPHEDLVNRVAGLVPDDKLSRTILWDLSNPHHTIGFNLLDWDSLSGHWLTIQPPTAHHQAPDQTPDNDKSQAQHGYNDLFSWLASQDNSPDAPTQPTPEQPPSESGHTNTDGNNDGVRISAYKIAEDIVSVFNQIWRANWGPRLQFYLEGALLTLASVNHLSRFDSAFASWWRKAEQWAQQPFDAHSAPEILHDFQITSPLVIRENLRLVRDKLFDAFNVCPTASPNPFTVSYIYISRAMQDFNRPTGMRMFHEILGRALKELQAQGVNFESWLEQEPRFYVSPQGQVQFMNHTLLDVTPLYLKFHFQQEARRVLRAANLNHLESWWQNAYDAVLRTNPRQLYEYISSLINKVDSYAQSDVAYRIFGQSNTTLPLDRVIDEGGVLLLNLAAGKVGRETAWLVGGTFSNWLIHKIAARDMDQRRPVFIIADEMQSFCANYSSLLSEMTKFGARLVMATQSLAHLSAIDPALPQITMSNVSTLFALACGWEDAEKLARELSVSRTDRRTVKPNDILGLPQHEGYVRTLDSARRPVVFSFRLSPPSEGDISRKERIISNTLPYTLSSQQAWENAQRGVSAHNVQPDPIADLFEEKEGKSAQTPSSRKGTKRKTGGNRNGKKDHLDPEYES